MVIKARPLNFPAKIGILIGTILLVIVAALAFSPLPQDPTYHSFADGRTAFGIPNFANVASNLGFLIFGVLGIRLVMGSGGKNLFEVPKEKLPYAVFFIGVSLVAFGSAYYHVIPTNETLVWDRLPMTVAFMALFAAFIMDRIHFRIGLVVMLPLLLLVGAGSVVYWSWTEAMGAGDLRPYFLVQFLPIFAIPLICLLFRGRYTSGKSVALMFLWYGLAKLFETFDSDIFLITGNTISGHSIKHLFAALVVYEALVMLQWAGRDNRPAALSEL
jgi:hypothetical protein